MILWTCSTKLTRSPPGSWGSSWVLLCAECSFLLPSTWRLMVEFPWNLTVGLLSICTKCGYFSGISPRPPLHLNSLIFCINKVTDFLFRKIKVRDDKTIEHKNYIIFKRCDTLRPNEVYLANKNFVKVSSMMVWYM